MLVLMPPGWTLVRLVSCPVELSLRQDRHLDELVRELQLMSGDVASERSQALAERLEGLLGGPAHARHTGRMEAMQAAAAGLEHLDVEMAIPNELAHGVSELQETVSEADRLCEEALGEQILIAPGSLFSNSVRFDRFARLNCGWPYTEEIDTALRRLGEIATGQLRAATPAPAPSPAIRTSETAALP